MKRIIKIQLIFLILAICACGSGNKVKEEAIPNNSGLVLSIVNDKNLTEEAAIKSIKEILKNYPSSNDLLLNAKDADGNSAIHVVYNQKKFEIFRFLLKAGSSLEVKNGLGKSILDFTSDIRAQRTALASEYAVFSEYFKSQTLSAAVYFKDGAKVKTIAKTVQDSFYNVLYDISAEAYIDLLFPIKLEGKEKLKYVQAIAKIAKAAKSFDLEINASTKTLGSPVDISDGYLVIKLKRGLIFELERKIADAVKPYYSNSLEVDIYVSGFTPCIILGKIKEGVDEKDLIAAIEKFNEEQNLKDKGLVSSITKESIEGAKIKVEAICLRERDKIFETFDLEAGAAEESTIRAAEAANADFLDIEGNYQGVPLSGNKLLSGIESKIDWFGLVRNNDLEGIRALIATKEPYSEEYRMLINQKNDSGDSAMHIASYNDYLELFKLLVELGASPDINDKDGKTPIELAKGKVLDFINDGPIIFKVDLTDVISGYATELSKKLGADKYNSYELSLFLTSAVGASTKILLMQHLKQLATINKGKLLTLIVNSISADMNGYLTLALGKSKSTQEFLNDIVGILNKVGGSDDTIGGRFSIRLGKLKNPSNASMLAKLKKISENEKSKLLTINNVVIADNHQELLKFDLINERIAIKLDEPPEEQQLSLLESINNPPALKHVEAGSIVPRIERTAEQQKVFNLLTSIQKFNIDSLKEVPIAEKKELPPKEKDLQTRIVEAMKAKIAVIAGDDSDDAQDDEWRVLKKRVGRYSLRVRYR